MTSLSWFAAGLDWPVNSAMVAPRVGGRTGRRRLVSREMGGLENHQLLYLAYNFSHGDRMRVRNTTTISTETLRDIVRFVCPPGVSGFDVRLNNCRGLFKGRAYAKGSGYHDRACPFVVLYIGGDEHFPYVKRWQNSRGGYLPLPVMADRIEALVYLAAHELRHLWQGRVPRGRRVWGARGQYSERDADAYALRMLRAWRRR